MAAAANPILFVLVFVYGATILNLFGVIVGYLFIKNNISLTLLRLIGISFAIYGIYLVDRIF